MQIRRDRKFYHNKNKKNSARECSEPFIANDHGLVLGLVLRLIQLASPHLDSSLSGSYGEKVEVMWFLRAWNESVYILRQLKLDFSY